MGFNYQAVIRNSSGEIIANTEVDITLNIVGDVDKTIKCSETFTVETNEFGLVNLVIGSQNPTDFAQINWADGPYFLEVFLNDVSLGMTQLLSVPYALYAASGNPGLSAYQVWLNLGNEGTEEDFINSLTGPSGSNGPAGPSAYQVWLDLGNEGTEDDFINSLTGPLGNTGPSAYQIWLDLGNEGTEEDFINSLTGPSGTTSWIDQDESVSTSKKVGIGTDTPTSMLQVVADSEGDVEVPLFEVKNKNGETVFAVYENSVKVFIDEAEEGSKTIGGFAVSGRTTTKETKDILVVTPEKTRVYVDEPTEKTIGGFAVSGRTTTKEDSLIFKVTPGLTEVFVDETPSKTRGGFAVSGRTTTKETIDILNITPNYTRIYVDQPGNKTIGGFAVSGRTTTKDTIDILNITPNYTRVYVDQPGGKTIGGFAVSGRTTTKETLDILDITPNYTRVYVDEPTEKTIGGFAVSGRTTTKQDGDEILKITPGLTEVFVNTTTDSKTRGGFAVSGRTTTKEEGIYDLFKVIPERTDVFIKPNPEKFFPDGFSISALDDMFDATELFNVSETGTFINTDLAIAPKLTTAGVIEITQTGALAGGEVLSYAGSPIWERGVVYSTQAQPTVNWDIPFSSNYGIVWDSEVPEGGYGQFSVNLQYLQPGKTYYVRAFAVNEEGLTGYGAQKSFQTLAPDTLTFIVKDQLTETDITNAVITITPWDSPWGETITNPAGNYVFYISPGYYSYEIQAPGYDGSWGEVYPEGGNIEEYVYLYPQPSQITFHVTNQYGDPVSGYEITLWDDFENYEWAYPEENGIAVVELNPGTWYYSIYVWNGGYEEYPEGTIVVNLGEDQTFDIILTELPKFTVTFIVETETGQPSVGAWVYLQSPYEGGTKKEGAKEQFYELQTDANGYAVIENVYQGNYTYYVYHDTDGYYEVYDPFIIDQDMTIPVTLMPVKGEMGSEIIKLKSKKKLVNTEAN
jgi:hypothetical protein